MGTFNLYDAVFAFDCSLMKHVHIKKVYECASFVLFITKHFRHSAIIPKALPAGFNFLFIHHKAISTRKPRVIIANTVIPYKALWCQWNTFYDIRHSSDWKRSVVQSHCFW